MVEVQVTSSGPGGPHLSPASGLKLKGACGSVPASGSITSAPPAPSVIRSAFFRAAKRLGEKVAAATSAAAGQDGCDAYEQYNAFFPLRHVCRLLVPASSTKLKKQVSWSRHHP